MIALLGKTSAGKNTIAEELEKRGYKIIVPYTTRPIRPGEVPGKTYHYTKTFKFLYLILTGFFAEHTSFKVANNKTWRYGTSKESLLDNDAILILNPRSFRSLLKNTNIDMFSVLLYVSPRTQRKRLNERGDSEQEANRRIIADNNDFVGIADAVDFIIQNDELKTPEQIAKIIDEKYRERNRLINERKQNTSRIVH